MGIGESGSGWVVIRSGGLGAFAKSRDNAGTWIDAFWSKEESNKVVDVTGAGNSFLGGLAAGLEFGGGDVLEGKSTIAKVEAKLTRSYFLNNLSRFLCLYLCFLRY